MMRRMACSSLAGVCVVGAAWGQCEPGWSGVFTPAEFDGPVEALSVFDDGLGPVLVAMGEFTRDGGYPGERLAAWNGQGWQTFPTPGWPLGSLQVMRADASRSRLCVARFNRTLYVRESGAWGEIALPALTATTNDIEFASDGSSDDVYLAGRYWLSGSDFAPVLHWDGQGWTRMGIAGTYQVDDIAWFDDGSGPRLYAAGARTLDGVQVDDLAVWNGSSWEPVALGRASRPSRLAVWDDGTGEALFTADGARIGRWDGEAWTEAALAPDAAGSEGFRVIEFGGTSRLVWSSARDPKTGMSRLSSWDGVDGEPLEGEVEGTVLALEGAGAFGEGLFIGGDFVRAGGASASGVARFDGALWSDSGSAENGNGAPDAEVIASAGRELGPNLGGRLYVGASFAGGRWARSLASWDGRGWSSIAPAGYESFAAHAILLGDLGEGPRLFAAGSVGEVFLERGVAAWDGERWAMLPPAYPSSGIYTLALGEVGGTRRLFIGGRFEYLGPERANYVGAFDGAAWHVLGDGLDDWVWTSIVFDDGAGPALYVGGEFAQAGGQAAASVARWDGEAWSPVGDGFAGDGLGPRVFALAVADLGSGPRLYAGGDFDSSGATPLGNVAVWNGSSWGPLGSGLEDSVCGLTGIETGGGERLAAAGDGVQLWDGSVWTPFAGTDGVVRAVAQATHEDGALYLVGSFTGVDGVPSEGIARFGCDSCLADFNGDGVLDTRDFIAFLNAWAHQDSGADIDGNGIVDTRDVVAYLNLWAAGC